MPLRTSERQEMPLIGGFGCLELVLYGIRVLAKQFLESNIDIGWRRLARTGVARVKYQRRLGAETDKL